MVQTGFQDRVAGAVGAAGVMIELADGVHLLGSLKSLGVVEDEVDGLAGSIDAVEQTQGHALQDTGFVEVAAPEELAVVGSVTVAAEQGVESLDGMFGPHGDCHHQAPEVRPGGLRKMPTLRTKETGQTAWYAAYGNHAVVLPIRLCQQHPYPPETPHFLCAIRDHDENRSV